MSELFDPGVALESTYADLPDRFRALLSPTAVAEPKLIKLNDELAQHLGFDPKTLKSTEGVAWLAGNKTAQGSQPLAMAYAGQQFGNWVPQLGDGRAHLLGELIAKDGLRYDIQLKGSGPTPFSRMGDGRAGLGPVLREYIVSEAMAALKVPTSRALAAVSTGEKVIREAVLPGAIVTRVARAHLRVGTFQYFAARQDQPGLALLVDYALARLYPHRKDDEVPALALLEEVIAAQAKLVAHWMGLGFIHGVMNTDNVSIAGETIDYGPCAFMDAFHADRVFSSIDEMGRYAYSNQPRVAHWNMVQFAQALLSLMGDTEEQAVERAQGAVNQFPALYESAYNTRMAKKLGFAEASDETVALTNDLLALMQAEQWDYTATFTALTKGEDLGEDWGDEKGKEWLGRWLSLNPDQALMAPQNPIFIPRNHRIEQAIRAALQGDFASFHRLVKVLTKPFTPQPGDEDLARPPQPTEIVSATFCGT
ncbi:MAG: YdiU family protein [Pseudomonadota bacterium]